MNSITLRLALVACLGGVSTAAAGSLSYFTTAENREVITLTGQLVEGDADQVLGLATEILNRGTAISGIRLNSPGGVIIEGVKLATFIKAGRLATIVTRGTVCASACFIAFAAGSEKFASYGARVGVHGASLVNATGARDSAEGTVAMAKIVKELGVPPGIIGQMVVTPADDIVWLSPSDLQSMGVQMTGSPDSAGDHASAPLSLVPASSLPSLLPAGRADPAVLRKAVAPLIRALSDCVAREVLQDPDTMPAYAGGRFDSFVPGVISHCAGDVSNLVQVYDGMDGSGQGMAFVNGPYATDLPRAVLKRIRPKLDEKLIGYNRDIAERAAREAQEKAAVEERNRTERLAREEEERRQAVERQTALALAEQKAAEAQAAAVQAQADAAAASAKLEAARQQQISDAKKAEGLLVDRAAECARQQLGSLVKSGETADVLASAVMTICAGDVAALLEGSVQEYRLERALPADDVGAGVYRERMRAQTREQIVALAVQAKAGVGAFAPARDPVTQ